MHRAGLGDRVEGRVHHRVAHASADHVVLPAVDLAPLHAAGAELGIEVAGEGVERLVVVVVGVEGEDSRGRSRVIESVSTGLGSRSARASIRRVLIADIADACALDWSFVSRGAGADGGHRARARSRASCEPTRCPRSSRTRSGIAPLAYRSGGLGTVYLGFPDESFPLDHPQQWLGQYDVGAVAYDLFPPESPIRRLYEWPELTRFVAAILGLDEIFPYADPLGALNLAVMTDGDQLQWHFDQTDFVVSLAIQNADVGGDFEVAPQIRTGRRRALRRRRARARRRTRPTSSRCR